MEDEGGSISTPSSGHGGGGDNISTHREHSMLHNLLVFITFTLKIFSLIQAEN